MDFQCLITTPFFWLLSSNEIRIFYNFFSRHRWLNCSGYFLSFLIVFEVQTRLITKFVHDSKVPDFGLRAFFRFFFCFRFSWELFFFLFFFLLLDWWERWILGKKSLEFCDLFSFGFYFLFFPKYDIIIWDFFFF